MNIKQKDYYQKALNTKEWLLRRALILTRDNFECTNCGYTEGLCVHHKAYENGRDPWLYTDEYLTTLCQRCHKEIHDVTPICNLIKEKLPKYVLPTKLLDAFNEALLTKPVLKNMEYNYKFTKGKYKGFMFHAIDDDEYKKWYIINVMKRK